MTSGRMRRVDEAIRQVIGGVVAGELKDPRVGFVTVTDVKTSADLSHARVYVSVLSDDRAAGGGSAAEGDRSQETLASDRFGRHSLRSHSRIDQHPCFDQQREATLAGLRSAHGYMQRRIATELRLKRTPTLEFVYDDTTDRAMRLERLMNAHPPAGDDEHE